MAARVLRQVHSFATIEDVPSVTEDVPSNVVFWHGVTWSQVLVFALAWELTYHVCKVAARRNYADHPKVVAFGASYATAFLNAAVCSVAGIYAVMSLHDADEAARSLMSPATVTPPAASAFVLLAAHSFLGWLLSDLVHLATHFPDLGGADMVLHHASYILLSIIGTGFRIAPFVVGWLMMGEVSSLFLNTRWLLINSGRGDAPALKRVEYAFAASFFVFRVVIFWAGMLHVLTKELPFLLAPPQSAPAWSLALLCGFVAVGAVLNIVWFGKIVRVALRQGPPPDKAPAKATSTRGAKQLTLPSVSVTLPDTELAMSPV